MTDAECIMLLKGDSCHVLVRPVYGESQESGLYASSGGHRPGAALCPVCLLCRRPPWWNRLWPPLQHHHHPSRQPDARGQTDTELYYIRHVV